MIASGRSPRSIQKVIDLFNGLMIPDAVLCCNGALTYNPRSKVISYPQFIPLDQALSMVQRLRSEIRVHGTYRSQFPPNENPESSGAEDLVPLSQPTPNRVIQGGEQGQDPAERMAGRSGFACEVVWFEGRTPEGELIYAKDTTFVCDQTWVLQRKHTIYYNYTTVEDTMEAFIESLMLHQHDPASGRAGGIIKLMALDRNRTAADVYESLPLDVLSMPAPAKPRPNDTDIANADPISVSYSNAFFLEIAAAGVNKGLGLQKYCEANRIPRENVVAFGDLLNDAEMLQYAGLGLCMGNGHESVKRLADRVIETNADDGVAKEIESWFL
ncbi:hypothetical protein BGZ98_001673 [Dissophora globulifera]|nr:hypothetical protein BGZ98_001673 [Dissophora globulifera]